MLVRFDPAVFGAPEWAGFRARRWVVPLCVLYALFAALMVSVVLQGQWEWVAPAVGTVLFSLWRIHRLHEPVVLVCRDRLLLLSRGWAGVRAGLWRPGALYWAVDYETIWGFSRGWREVWLGQGDGALVKVPVGLSQLSANDRERLSRRIEEKQQVWRRLN